MPRERSGARMAKAWSGFFSNPGVDVGTTQVNLLQGGSSSLRQTILRVRGAILVASTGNAASDSCMLGLGLVVVSEEAANAGGTALPGPIADMSADWLWHQFVPMDQLVGTAADAQSITTNARIEIDAKAMRKLGPGKVLVLMGETSTNTFTETLVQAGMRILTAH